MRFQRTEASKNCDAASPPGDPGVDASLGSCVKPKRCQEKIESQSANEENCQSLFHVDLLVSNDQIGFTDVHTLGDCDT